MGTAYTWDWGNVSLFYVLFGKTPEIYFPTLQPPFFSTRVVNPEPKAVNLLNLNLDLDLDLYKWTGFKKGQAVFTFRIENLLDYKIYVPTFAYSGSPNSFPYRPSRTCYTGLRINF